jgi:drug/metabolite transporter (DMT)-like permease
VIRTILLTAFALVAFAFNSILCRLALRGDEADAAGFTSVRLISGAVTLIVISFFVRSVSSPHVSKGSTSSRRALTHVRATDTGSWLSALWLAAYAVCFSFAYLNLTAGTGALILFGSVQMTMIAISLGRGERPRPLEWLGLAIAVGGLVYLVLPGLASPPLNSSLLMAAAGASWGLYTLRGKGSSDPLADTTGNFVKTVPFAIALVVIFFLNIHLTTRGVMLAVLSGSLASDVGYTVWYAALKFHTATRAAVLQLAVPVIAAAGGVLFMAEQFTTRLLIAGALILGGIAMTIAGKKRS